ncbi:penicillin-binding protein, beta-lactamase class C [Owenweeksia hongkongensis DSM 17368]|uniref:Penicillin-binding protein, beta-lactamase class C n=1 Tax=Owenweeksia hongkongensis (strain DSM 17368 / CIP 108786 / JCM 12287 / NRRL B-23963 / UST20020801) TaxID=926562 RepID=G8R8W6_OWEHD|nr:serine hydrolase [Owenweeksia hongkongensis]AEV33574.1 penicillin-binding protein, beta-lactamase class C [Owenweeksia hongkongensis DSM 17368]
MKSLYIFLFALLYGSLSGQYYFPPLAGNAWDTVNPSSLGWCSQKLDTVHKYLEARHSKSFIILHKGKIADEIYMNGFAQDSAWYWASAGKTLAGFLTGMVQEDGLLNVNDKTSDYLGTGWTLEPQAKEDLITIRHQLSMTSGLDYNISDLNCLEDTCLKYLHDAGNHWYYHNAPYRLVQDVLENASGKNMNTLTYQKLGSTIGLAGLWYDYVFYSKARNMARFGLLNLNKGNWAGTTILQDSTYLYDMVHPSQNLNEAYGYLWWLNGQSSYRRPGLDIVFPGFMVPEAPADMYMAAGKNDQRIYVIPSMDLVVVRQGEAAYTSQLALSTFDNELWELLMDVFCQTTALHESEIVDLQVYPNPASGFVNISSSFELKSVQLISLQGEVVKRQKKEFSKLNIQDVAAGVYFLQFETLAGESFQRKLVVK